MASLLADQVRALDDEADELHAEVQYLRKAHMTTVIFAGLGGAIVGTFIAIGVEWWQKRT